MAENEDFGSPGWTASASYIMQTTEDVVARAVAAAAAAATVHTSRPSVIFSSKDENGNSQLQKLQRQVTRVLKGFSSPPEVNRGAYNPEVLTSQKRQWASLQLQSLDQRPVNEPSRLFESMVVVGLHPNCDIQALQKRVYDENSDGPKKIQTAVRLEHQIDGEPKLQPQILFVYPPEKQLPLNSKDLLSFCFPGGLEGLFGFLIFAGDALFMANGRITDVSEWAADLRILTTNTAQVRTYTARRADLLVQAFQVHAVEKTPSMSELNEILLGQEHLKQSDLSFVFRLQVAECPTLYGCCVLVEEIVQKPSGLISMISEEQPFCSSLSRLVITTPRCYCILSRLPFFDLHFGILKSIFTEERLERLTKGVGMLGLVPPEECDEEETYKKSANSSPKCNSTEDIEKRALEMPEASIEGVASRRSVDNGGELKHLDIDLSRETTDMKVNFQVNSETGGITTKSEPGVTMHISNGNDVLVDGATGNKQTSEKRLPETVLPLLRYHQYESSESSTSFQGSPCEDRPCRSEMDEAEMEEASSSGQDDSSDHIDILEWAKANNHGSLQIICEYYRLRRPARGSTLTFHPLEHLHPLEFRRPAETILHIAGSSIDLRSCSTSLEVAEAHGALLAEEEAVALSVWTVACICGNLRLEHVLTMFAGALLEKQILVVCSNLGILSAIILSIIPLIRPYHWQSLLMPVLPNDMLEFLDAPVPYVVGVKNKSSEVQSKLATVVVIDANKNQVRSPGLPQLPQHKELLASLSPYHAKLVGESYLARKRPVYECTDVQVEAVKGFLAVLRSYLDSLCSNLRSHTITNVQSNDDKVSLLLKESFIDSFPTRDRPFMKLFVDTQLFSVHTDLVLSFYQKE